MPILRKELNSLYSFIVASPCVQPFFGYKASMLLLSQIPRRFKPPFPALITPDPMIYRGCLVYFSRHFIPILIIPATLLPLGFLVLFQPLLPHLLVPLHHLLLLLCELGLLRLKLLLSFIYSPGPLELPRSCISRLMSFQSQLLPVSFS
jgi:hypothetical protein